MKPTTKTTLTDATFITLSLTFMAFLLFMLLAILPLTGGFEDEIPLVMGTPVVAPLTPLEAFLANDSGDEIGYDLESHHCVHFSCALIDNLTEAGYNASPIVLATSRPNRWSHMCVVVNISNELVYVEAIHNEIFPVSKWDEDLALGDSIELWNLTEARVCAVPYTENELSSGNVSSKNVSILIPYNDLQYNETTLATVTDFMSRMPEYAGGGQCVSRSRYVAFEAHEHGLNVSTCIVGGAGSASKTEKHQINTFTDDGTRYYTSNLHIGDTSILTYGELLDALNGVFVVKLTSLNARGYWTP